MDIAAELFTLPALATLVVGLVAGLLRGFTGFGGAVFAIPVLSLVYPPTTAIAVVLAAGLVGTVQLLPGALPLTNWRESAPIVLVALAVMPFGTYALLNIDPVLVRRGIGSFVLVAGLFMLRGWSWRGPRTAAINGAVGAASGLVTGLGGVGGAIATLYLMSSTQPVEAIRANLIIVIGALTVGGFGYLAAAGGLAASDLLKISLYLPAYLVTVWVGSRIFRGTSAALYRRVAKWLLVAVRVMATVW
ncbi:MAG: sulfite exporter TauE/SafE family protein [Candidatus Tectomicrobia bacterium]|nr:sulfite exporter TauE/SafE family protein [Candidatus Tectomicrobia bacterium]